jgi:hypothetical protein
MPTGGSSCILVNGPIRLAQGTEAVSLEGS